MGLLPESGITPADIGPHPGATDTHVLQHYQQNKKLNYTADIRADFAAVSGGADCSAALAAAINSGAPEVLIPIGEFWTDPFVLDNPGQKLTLAPGAVLKLNNGSDDDMITVTADDVTITGFGALDGNRAGQSIGYGITGQGISGLTITGIGFDSIYEAPVFLGNVTGLNISDNRFTNSGVGGNRKAIVITDDGGNSSDIIIDGNRIDGTANGNGGIVCYSTIDGTSVERIAISNNIIILGSHADDRLGIELFARDGGAVRYATITGNVITCPGSGSDTFGISVGGEGTSSGNGPRSVAISGNTIEGCDRLGIEAIGRTISVTGNTINLSGPISVISVDVEGDQRGCVVVGNTITACTNVNYALQILAGTGTTRMHGTIVANNNIDGSAGQGIVVGGDFVGGIISGNTILRSVLSGIVINSGTVTTDSQIINNYLDMSQVDPNGDGIIINSSAAADLVIAGNIVANATRHGIHLAQAVNRVDVRNNLCHHNGTHGINTNGGDRITIVGNHCHHNGNRGISLSGSPTLTYVEGNYCHQNTNEELALGGTQINRGTATLVGGTATVSNVYVETTSRIVLTVQSLGTVTAPKAVAVTARVAGTSFTITSADATDTSVIGWQIHAA